jgi:hypothetical protein
MFAYPIQEMERNPPIEVSQEQIDRLRFGTTHHPEVLEAQDVRSS